MNIVQAKQAHLEQVAQLFDLYRQFYKCPADLDLARRFIAERVKHGESTIFVALDDASAVGFVQLYPSFCSVEAIKRLVLYDLYVDSSARGRGVGEALMNRATDYAREIGAKRIDLQTAHSNKIGQRLYEKLGYLRDTEFYDYSLSL